MNRLAKTILIIGIAGGGAYLLTKHILPALKKKEEPEVPKEAPKEEEFAPKETPKKEEAPTIVKLKKNYIYRVAGTNVNVRSEPSRQSKVVKIVPKDKLFVVVEVSEKDKEGYHWGKVQTFGEERVEVEKKSLGDFIKELFGEKPEVKKETIVAIRLIGQPLGWIREDLLQVVGEAKNIRR